MPRRRFNWANAAGMRGGAKFYTKEKIERKFDKEISLLLKKLDKVKANEWQMGMITRRGGMPYSTNS